MKKYLVFILILLLVPFIVKAEETCSKNITIKEMTVQNKDEKITILSSEVIDNKSIINLKASEDNTSIEYKIIIKNNSKDTYKITKKDNYNTNYVDYELNIDNNEIKANEEVNATLKITYKNKIVNTTEDKNILELDFISIEKEITEEKSNNTMLVIIIIVVAVIAILGILYFSKKQQLIILLIAISIFTYTKANAICSEKIIIESNIVLEEQDAIFQTGKDVNIKMKQFTNKNVDKENIKDKSIKAIKYSSVEPGEDNKKERNIVSTPDSPFEIYMWYKDGVIYWWSEDKTPKLNEDSSRMFIYLDSLTDIEGLENFNTIDVKNLSHAFAYDTNLKSIKALRNWNTINVVDLNATFINNFSLENLEGLENWNTSNVTTMHSTFGRDTKLTKITELKDWDVRKVEVMQSIFSSCINVEVIDLSGWETESLINMNNMFGMWDDNRKPRLDSKLREIKMSKSFNTSKVTDLIEVFANNTHIEDYSFLEYFDTSNVKSMKQLFQCNYGLKDLKYVKNWNTSKLEDLEDTFSFLRNLESLDGLENWDVSNVKNMRRTFVSNQKMYDIKAISNWNTANVETIELLFGESFELVDTTPLSNWNLKSVTNYTEIFYHCPKINLPTFNNKKGTWGKNGTFYPS